MKILSYLPDRTKYLSLASEIGNHRFRDCQSKAFEIKSPVPDPFDQEWTILFSVQKQKSDKSEYPYKLVLRLYPPKKGELITKGLIEREIFKGVFASSGQPTTSFYALPIESTSQISNWLTYSILTN